MATKVTLQVPEDVSAAAQRKAHEAAVLALWELAELSTSEAAEALGLSHHDFLELLAAKGTPVERGPFNVAAVDEAQRKLTQGEA